MFTSVKVGARTLKHNDNSKLVREYSLIRVFTSATRFIDYRTQRLQDLIEWLKNKPIFHTINDDYCCVSVYITFNSNCEYMKYQKEMEKVMQVCA